MALPAASSTSLIAKNASVAFVPQSGWSKLKSAFAIHSGCPNSRRLCESSEKMLVVAGRGSEERARARQLDVGAVDLGVDVREVSAEREILREIGRDEAEVLARLELDAPERGLVGVVEEGAVEGAPSEPSKLSGLRTTMLSIGSWMVL